MLPITYPNQHFALITDACGDTGYHLARQLAAEQKNLVLLGNRQDILYHRAGLLQRQFKVKVIKLVKELGVASAAAETYNDLQAMGLCIDHLANIAAPVADSFIESYPENDADLLQRNIISFTSFTKYFMRDMLKRNKGTIYHIPPPASLPGIVLCSGIRQFIVSFTTALARETMHTNISVMCWSGDANENTGVTKSSTTELRLVTGLI
jgi:uncharacterized protein